ncbi:MAG: 50S ribosomal protein L3 [Myxococcales bacterium]|nr:50S ribosomal protein L3 [Myxococcales bacterium]
MNQNPGLIGKKLGSTQLFLGDRMVNCSVIEATPLVVVGHRTKAKDGYTAVILGLGKRKASRTTKPLAGQFKKANVEPPQTVKELRVDESQLGLYPVGGQVDLNAVFQEGQFVDVQGKSRGRGFTGVVRRWSFAGFVQTHGTHEYRRHGGSIGTNMTPGRTLPNIKMPGHYGDETVSALNLKIAKIDAEAGLVLVEGGVPGSRNSVVVVRGAVKKKNGGKKA